MTPEESRRVVVQVANQNGLTVHPSDNVNELPSHMGEGCITTITICQLTMIACSLSIAARLVGASSIPISTLTIEAVKRALDNGKRFDNKQLLGGFQLLVPKGDPIIVLSPWAFMDYA